MCQGTEMRWKDIFHWDLYSGGRVRQHTNINVYFKSQPVEYVRQQRPDGTSSHVAGTGTAPGPQLTGRSVLCPHQPHEEAGGEDWWQGWACPQHANTWADHSFPLRTFYFHLWKHSRLDIPTSDSHTTTLLHSNFP